MPQMSRPTFENVVSPQRKFVSHDPVAVQAFIDDRWSEGATAVWVEDDYGSTMSGGREWMGYAVRWVGSGDLPEKVEPKYEFTVIEGGRMPVNFQGGFIVLEPYGCRNCGNGFWTEGDAKRKLESGAHPCPHCHVYSRVEADR